MYTSSGEIVENGLGAFISCGEKAVEYHDKLTKAMRGDNIILDSLLRKYWIDFGNDDSSADVKEEEEEIRLKIKNAQMKPQNANKNRNGDGRMMKCKELQSLISEQRDLEGSKLIGYAMPSDSDGFQLFWRKAKTRNLFAFLNIDTWFQFEFDFLN